LLSLCISIIGNLPQAQAALSGDDFVTEVTGFTALAESAKTVAIDSSDRLFVVASNDVWRSTDYGASWAEVFNPNTRTESTNLFYVDSRDYIFVLIYEHPNYDLYRSTDHGDTWSKVCEGLPHCWDMDEAPNGDLYFNTYASHAGDDIIYKSTNGGADWTVFYNITGVKHIHCVQVNEYNGTQMYAATGDNITANEQRYLFYDGVSWSNLTLTGSATSIWFDSEYVYWAADGWTPCYRTPHGGTWDQREMFLDLRTYSTTTNFAFEGCKIDDMMFMGTEDGQVWGSWDGEHWVKIQDYGDSGSVFRFTRAKPIHYVEKTGGKLYRLNVEVEDLVRLYYGEFLQHRGSRTNAVNYTITQKIHNGTQRLDLTGVALENVQASITGLSRRNNLLDYKYIDNAGFERNNYDGWYIRNREGSYGLRSIDSTEKHSGSYSVKYVKDAGDTLDGSCKMYNGSEYKKTTMQRGDIVVLTCWIKGNVSSSEKVTLQITNYTSDMNVAYCYADLTTSWTRVGLAYILTTADSLDVRTTVLPRKGISYEIWLDDFHLEVWDVAIGLWNGGSANSIDFSKPDTATINWTNYYFHVEQANDWNHTYDLNTTNPSLQVGGQTVSYAGELANGAESSVQNLTGYFTGALTVSANIQGSGQCIFNLKGTRVLYEDSLILEGRKDNVYYGRYYGTFSPTINTDDLVAVTSLASSITSLSYSFNKLSLTISLPSNMTSTNKVYCGIRGEPIAIYTANGTQTWSYNASTTILTLNITHKSPSRITIYWKLPGDIDSDGDVDIYDLYILAVTYGSHVDEPNYNSNSDIDGNNHVYFDDLCILAGDYGELKP